MLSIVPFDKIAVHIIRNSHHSLAAFTSASQLSIFSTKWTQLIPCYYVSLKSVLILSLHLLLALPVSLGFSHHFNMIRGRRVSQVETFELIDYFMAHNVLFALWVLHHVTVPSNLIFLTGFPYKHLYTTVNIDGI